MNSAEKFKDHEPSILNEVILASYKEEIIFQNISTLLELFLSSIKVKVNIQMSQEFCDGILVCVALLLNYSHKVLEIK